MKPQLRLFSRYRINLFLSHRFCLFCLLLNIPFTELQFLFESWGDLHGLYGDVFSARWYLQCWKLWYTHTYKRALGQILNFREGGLTYRLLKAVPCSVGAGGGSHGKLRNKLRSSEMRIMAFWGQVTVLYWLIFLYLGGLTKPLDLPPGAGWDSTVTWGDLLSSWLIQYSAFVHLYMVFCLIKWRIID